jgi:hypothetical protein
MSVRLAKSLLDGHKGQDIENDGKALQAISLLQRDSGIVDEPFHPELPNRPNRIRVAEQLYELPSSTGHISSIGRKPPRAHRDDHPG